MIPSAQGNIPKTWNWIKSATACSNEAKLRSTAVMVNCCLKSWELLVQSNPYLWSFEVHNFERVQNRWIATETDESWCVLMSLDESCEYVKYPRYLCYCVLSCLSQNGVGAKAVKLWGSNVRMAAMYCSNLYAAGVASKCFEQLRSTFLMAARAGWWTVS